jgi:hypothetical protein
MKTIEITPQYVIEKYGPKEEATITISRMNIYFNASAAKLLALKKDDTFQFVLIEDGNLNSLHYKDSINGFRINTINEKGRAQCVNKNASTALYVCLSKTFSLSGKAHKFTIGDFKEGLWQLIPTTNSH